MNDLSRSSFFDYARRMKKKNQDAGLTLKELYKIIRAHSDYVKLSKESSEKVDTQKQKEKFSEDHGNLESKYWTVWSLQENPSFQRRPVWNFSKVNMWMHTATMNMNLLLDLNGHHFPSAF